MLGLGEKEEEVHQAPRADGAALFGPGFSLTVGSVGVRQSTLSKGKCYSYFRLWLKFLTLFSPVRGCGHLDV